MGLIVASQLPEVQAETEERHECQNAQSTVPQSDPGSSGDEQHQERDAMLWAGKHDGRMLPRWRTLRCADCRRPIGRAQLAPGSAVVLRCRRDRQAFVFVVTEAGRLLVMRRG